MQNFEIPDFPPYPAYKPSGVKWIGDIPAHWDTRRLRYVAEMRVSNVDKHVKLNESPVRLCNYVDVYHNERISADLDFMRATATDREIERFRLERGDVIITKDSETWNDIGVPALVEYTADDLVCGYHLALLRPYKSVMTGAYLLRALQAPMISAQFHIQANGVTRYGLTQNAIKNVRLPLPPLPEQRAIAAYLDRKGDIARRYAIVARRIIATLRELRQIDIHDAVTRGLNEHVPLKPSGVEWLGDIPSHWDARRLKYWVEINKRTLSEKTDPDFEFRYIEIGGVSAGALLNEPAAIRFGRAPSRARRIVRQGDTIVSTVRAYLKAVWFAEDDDDDLVCSTGFAVLTPKPDAFPKFVSYVAQSDAFTHQVMVNSVGVAYPAISNSKLRSLLVPVPPLPEQRAIAAHLDAQTAKIDAAIAHYERMAELVAEYWTVLAADAVTGRIDLRQTAAGVE